VGPEPASGTLIFLFTDVEGSTRLWERLPEAMKAALERHDRILQAAVAASGGRVVKTTGDGIMAVFSSAAAAVRACLTAQQDLAAEPWGSTGPLRVRMGLHAGEAATRSSDYFVPSGCSSWSTPTSPTPSRRWRPWTAAPTTCRPRPPPSSAATPSWRRSAGASVTRRCGCSP
jgi:Adenylate and Guanylate cyclase catalytic domain